MSKEPAKLVLLRAEPPEGGQCVRHVDVNWGLTVTRIALSFSGQRPDL